MWKNINHLINKKSKSTNISSLQVDDEVIVESSSMSNLFNEYFTNIKSTLLGHLLESSVNFETCMKVRAYNEFSFSEIIYRKYLMRLVN